MATLMAEHWGKCFPMGGIGGAPFVGQTGFGAFSAHVPEDGNIVILFGPHIAISDAGELGQYLREGQTKHSTACGAVLGVYAQCKQSAAAGAARELGNLDMQMDWLRQQVAQSLERIDSADEPLNELIYAVFEKIQTKMAKIVNTNFGIGRLVLIGGIQINMPAPYIDHFMPLQFDVLSSQDKTMHLLEYLVWGGANSSDLEVPPLSKPLSVCREPPADWEEQLIKQKQEIAALRAELRKAKADAFTKVADVAVAKAAEMMAEESEVCVPALLETPAMSAEEVRRDDDSDGQCVLSNGMATALNVHARLQKTQVDLAEVKKSADKMRRHAQPTTPLNQHVNQYVASKGPVEFGTPSSAGINGRISGKGSPAASTSSAVSGRATPEMRTGDVAYL